MKPRQPADDCGKVLIPEDENLLDLRRTEIFLLEEKEKEYEEKIVYLGVGD